MEDSGHAITLVPHMSISYFDTAAYGKLNRLCLPYKYHFMFFFLYKFAVIQKDIKHCMSYLIRQFMLMLISFSCNDRQRHGQIVL